MVSCGVSDYPTFACFLGFMLLFTPAWRGVVVGLIGVGARFSRRIWCSLLVGRLGRYGVRISRLMRSTLMTGFCPNVFYYYYVSLGCMFSCPVDGEHLWLGWSSDARPELRVYSAKTIRLKNETS